jgi:YD repeat-containing protein
MKINMSPKRMLFLLGLGCFMHPAGYSQTQQSLQSGNVDSKMLPNGGGDVSSPNLFNGTANVTIPIYNSGSNSISLSYNTAGVTVDEDAGIVGLHWSLNAGGSITRNLKDIPDEMNKSMLLSLDGATAPTDGVGLKGKWCQYFGGVIPDFDDERYYDAESDDFILSVGDLNFTFNIGQGGAVYTTSLQQNVKIDLLLDGVPVTTANGIPANTDYNYNSERISFRVRDAQGNTYYFIEGDLSQMNYNGTGLVDLSYNYISRWVLQKEIRSDGREIDYQYNLVDNSANNNIDYFSCTALEQDINTFSTNAIQGTPTNFNQVLLKSSNIASITYPDKTTASFIYNTTANSRCDGPAPNNAFLTEIQVTSADQGMRYVFDQAYAVSLKDNQTYTPTTTPPTETPLSSCQQIDGAGIPPNARYHRLILKGIHMATMDGSSTQPYYTFKYNYSSTFRLPPRFSGRQDFFGYFNGKTVTANNGMLSIPLHTARYSASPVTYGVDKSDDASFAVADILDTVQNAYGGMTVYTYEGHQLSNVLSDAGITMPTDNLFLGANANDGVRVKTITTLDPHYPGKFQRQTFAYTGGQRFMPGGYFDYPVYTIDPNATSYINESYNTLFNNTFVSSHQFVNGSNHGYSEVTITSTNDLGQQLFKKDMTFQNISRGSGNTSYFVNGSKNYFEAPYTDKQYIKDWEIGLPLVTTEYDQYNNLLSITTNTYNSITDDMGSSGKVENIKTMSTNENGYMTPFASEFYRPYAGMSLLTQTTAQKFLGSGNSTTDIVNYSYDDHQNLSGTTTQDSRGASFTLKNIYNYNVSGPNLAYGNVPGTLYNMTTDGLEIKVGMERWKNGPPLTYSDKLMDASITRYQYQSGKIWTNKLYMLQSSTPIGYTAYTGISSNSTAVNPYTNILNAYDPTYTQPLPNFQVASEALQYDIYGNPIETQLLGQNSYLAMVWDPIPGNKVAEVQNARLADIGSANFEPLIGVSYTGNANLVDGGFTYNEWGRTNSIAAVSGGYCFRLITGPTANTYVSSPIVTAGKTYVMTYWSQGTLPVIKDAGNAVLSATPQYTLANGWVNYKVTFTPTVTGPVQFTTTGTSYLDEIRLFPVGAMMKNWVYTPLLGVTSSTDPSGRITYYQYDAFGRLAVTKDQDGNVLSKTDYRIGQ